VAISAAVAGTDYVATEADPIVGAVSGLVKADGLGAISPAVAGADYVDIEEDPIVGAVSGLVKADGLGAISAAVAGTDYVVTEEDPIVGAVSGLVKADGAGAIFGAVAGTDYVIPAGNVATATKLATPRALNGANFDGSADVTVPVASADDNATSATMYPLWTTAAGNNAAKVSTTKLTFAPDTGILTATGFSGSGSALTGVVKTEADPVVKAINGLVKSNGVAISAAVAGTDYVATEADPIVGAVSGLVKADGLGAISAAVAGADYVDIEEDPIVGAVSGLVKADGLGAISAAVAGTDYVVTEEDPIVGAVSGLVKADGAGAIAAATAGTDYLVPSSNGIPTYARVTTSDVTETGQALADITGLSVALAASAVYEFEANLPCAGDTGTDGNAYGVNFSGAAGATLEASLYAPPTSTTMKTERINALNTASSAYFTTASQSGGVLIKGIISTNGDTGNLTIKQLKVVSGTATVYVGSYLKVTRIN